MTTTAVRPETQTILLTDADVERLGKMLKAITGPNNSLRSYGLAVGREIERARVVPARDVPADVVTMRSRIRIRDARTRKTDTYTLVYPWEATAFSEALSVLAPLGTAVLGLRVGDTFTVDVPAGTRTLTVEEVVYQPEAAGQYDL